MSLCASCSPSSGSSRCRPDPDAAVSDNVVGSIALAQPQIRLLKASQLHERAGIFAPGDNQRAAAI
jgi:hypothetical protein